MGIYDYFNIDDFITSFTMETATMLDAIRLIVGTGILTFASYTDIKTRRASNALWIIMGSIGICLLIIQYFTVGFTNIYYLMFIPIMIIFMYILFQLRLIFGGADAKAIMALALLVPIVPSLFDFPLWKESIMPGSWVIFANSIVLFLFIPLSLLVYNISKKSIKLPYCVLGYKTSVEKAREKFVWPLERINNGKRKFSYMPTGINVEEELEEFIRNGIKEIWVTPKVPFMIPLLAGFICSFFLGDILTHLLNSIA
jgi:preflagellin peptidase FlaK